jgi:hypothetical protein
MSVAHILDHLIGHSIAHCWSFFKNNFAIIETDILPD